MLENRSFDHVFGFSPINGTDAVTGTPTTIDRPDPAVNSNTDSKSKTVYPVHDGADFSFKGLDLDAGHEFPDVRQQLAGANGGLVDNYASHKAKNPGRVMDCFSPWQAPPPAILSRQPPSRAMILSTAIFSMRWRKKVSPGASWKEMISR
jgi:phospholipase C